MCTPRNSTINTLANACSYVFARANRNEPVPIEPVFQCYDYDSHNIVPLSRYYKINNGVNANKFAEAGLIEIVGDKCIWIGGKDQEENAVKLYEVAYKQHDERRGTRVKKVVEQLAEEPTEEPTEEASANEIYEISDEEVQQIINLFEESVEDDPVNIQREILRTLVRIDKRLEKIEQFNQKLVLQ